MIRSQQPQTPLDGTAHILAMVATKIWIIFQFSERILGRDHKMIPVASYKLTDELLAGAISVVIGCVNEITPGPSRKRIKNFLAFIFRRAPAPVIAKGHRAKAQLRNS